MKQLPPDAILPWWIEHGPLPPFVPVELWADEHRADQQASREFWLRARRTFDDHAFACWHRLSSCWDMKLNVMGQQVYMVSRAPLDDLLAAAAAQGFCERHRETLPSGVACAELLIALKGDRTEYNQMKVWLGDTPLHRAALGRRYDFFDGWMEVRGEDRVLLCLLYKNPGWAAQVLADDRDRYHRIQHATLDEWARSLGLDVGLIEARGLAAKVEDD